MGGIRHTISMKALDNFAIDDDLILYWDGELVQTMTKYSLPWWQQVLFCGGAIGGIAAGIATVGLFMQGQHWL